MRRGQGASLVSGFVNLCVFAARADLAKQRRQLAEMPQWQFSDIGIDPVAAKAEAEKSSWGAEPPWQKPQWQLPKWNRLVWRSFARL